MFIAYTPVYKPWSDRLYLAYYRKSFGRRPNSLNWAIH